MTEAEVEFPTRCPICRQELLASFRLSVVANGLVNGDIRLYARCHVTSWDASTKELARIRQFLDASWGVQLQEACDDLSISSLSGSIHEEEFFCL